MEAMHKNGEWDIGTAVEFDSEVIWRRGDPPCFKRWEYEF
jgi:hypothetical protein